MLYILLDKAGKIPSTKLRYWIISTRMKRMAAAYPFDRHPAALPSSIPGNSFITILGAGRVEAAGAG
jgi:hypothetical protein